MPQQLAHRRQGYPLRSENGRARVSEVVVAQLGRQSRTLEQAPVLAEQGRVRDRVAIRRREYEVGDLGEPPFPPIARCLLLRLLARSVRAELVDVARKQHDAPVAVFGLRGVD